jgi:hypothetical protein
LALSDNLRKWINVSHALAFEGAAAAAKNVDEPGLVSALLDTSIQTSLERELQAASGPAANVRIDSVFTHKTPTVRHSGQSPVEIGDLLLIRQHFSTTGGKPQGKALLLQAKKNGSPNSGSVTTGNPNIQFELYRTWPSFTGATRLPHTPEPTSPNPWDFKLTDPNGRFGQYLAVFDVEAHSFTAPSTLGAETTAFAASSYPKIGPFKTTWANGPLALPPAIQPSPVDCPKDFAETLAEIFQGKAGEHFVPGLMSGTDHWSIFVNTMLLEAAKIDYTFVSRRTNVNTPTPRGATIRALVAMQPFFKLAVMQELERYSPEVDADGLMDFQREPYFIYEAQEKSPFIADLMRANDMLRRRLRDMDGYRRVNAMDDRGREPPIRSFESDNEERGNHVPILSIATSGPGPFWEDSPRRE